MALGSFLLGDYSSKSGCIEMPSFLSRIATTLCGLVKCLYATKRQGESSISYQWEYGLQYNTWTLRVPEYEQGSAYLIALTLYDEPITLVPLTEAQLKEGTWAAKVIMHKFGTIHEVEADAMLAIMAETQPQVYRPEFESYFRRGELLFTGKYGSLDSASVPKMFGTIYGIEGVVAGDLHIKWEDFKRLFTNLNLPERQRDALKAITKCES